MRRYISEFDNSVQRLSVNTAADLAIPVPPTGPMDHATALDHHIELSVVIPCLNEADTLADCIEKAQHAMRDNRIAGEIVIADNGSSDGSIEIARRLGARVVAVHARGYGNALMGGIAAAAGEFIIMGDADGSYDFAEIPRFLEKLRAGNDLVQGCRLPSGGGTVASGAMPLLHRWLGNPLFSMLARRWFKSPFPTSTAGCEASGILITNDCSNDAPGWNSRPR